jgi:hypothetical protein
MAIMTEVILNSSRNFENGIFLAGDLYFNGK